MSLRIRALKLERIGCFESIKIPLNDSMNIICGENGIGKTTILDSIALCFCGNIAFFVTKNANSSTPGTITAEIKSGTSIYSSNFRVDKFLPSAPGAANGPWRPEEARHFIHIRANRELQYQTLNSIGRDPEKNDHACMTETSHGIRNQDLKSWFTNRYLFSAHNSLTKLQKENLDFAIKSFSVLNDDVRFSSVRADSFDIMVDTNDGIIPFEFLSSGYRTSLFTILGIVKEIELRRLEVPASLFSGIVMIDEIDMHLHPTWQQKILEILRTSFPSAQFIVATHSPHVIQAAEPGQVIALVRGRDGRPVENTLSAGEYGFKGWSVEEILQDVMGLKSVHSKKFSDALKSFEAALDNEDTNEIDKSFSLLDKMLHPSSHLRKLFRLQSLPYLGDRN